MAENVFAVTQSPPGKKARTVPRSEIRHRSTAFNELAFDLLDDVYVSSGKPLAGMLVRIRDGNGEMCADRQPGGIEIFTDSLFYRYWATMASSATR